LARNTSDPSRPFAYHGWFPCRNGRAFYNDGMQVGADIAHGATAIDPGDPLRGPTPLPPEEALPGWRDAVRRYFLGMERIGAAITATLARGLGVPVPMISDPFIGGMSALRLLRYPLRPPEARAGIPDDELHVLHHGAQRMLIQEAHVDFGFVTLLAQNGVAGLQARSADGTWIDIPPVEDTLVVNFGGLIERWSGGRIRATEHRVLWSGRERFSIPFFYEPRADALIAPLPIAGTECFVPFRYGDYVWSSLPRYHQVFGERVVVAA
jgi:isopenicillin N synthase-like dioxygenase